MPRGTSQRRGSWTSGLIQAGWVLVCASALFDTALAQSTRDRLSMLEEDQRRMERLLQNNQASQTQLLQDLQMLQGETRALRDEIERLQFDAVQSADRQRNLYLDLDQRLQAIEGGVTAAAGSSGLDATPGVVPGGGQNDADDYRDAFELLKQGRYIDARVAFQGFLQNWPDSGMRDNAQYWLAETWYVTREFATALTEFDKLITGYPNSRKVPDALLKLGYCNYELQRWQDARRALDTVIAQYPESTAARLARQRLTQMSSEGR